MTLQVEFTWLVGLFFTFLGACVGMGKVLLMLQQRHQDDLHRQLKEELSAISTARAKDSGELQRIERDWLTWKADLPLQYVRREDYVRNQTVIEAKLDALAGQNARITGMLGGNQ
ncbi:hypothetical protein [uncultured Pseudacidovorax sp.]|uniref:hypothetical protein n=1 Tax=uncultured Pseudacidovorax sp. TaxID=679313 RepID=UPI0025E16BBF|nr:hypothetical protein [uncultured Pseudacidovorax sp.]